LTVHLFGVHNVQMIASVISAALVLLSIIAMFRLIKGARTGNLLSPRLVLQPVHAAALAANFVRPGDSPSANDPARAPPLLEPRSTSPRSHALSRE
jgi:hypothetical protein